MGRKLASDDAEVWWVAAEGSVCKLEEPQTTFVIFLNSHENLMPLPD